MMIYGDIGTSPLYLGPLLIVPLSNPVNTVPIYDATSCVFWTLTLECTFMCLLTFHTLKVVHMLVTYAFFYFSVRVHCGQQVVMDTLM